MKISVVGLGSIGRRHLKGLKKIQKKLQLSAIKGFDLSEERRNQAFKEVPGIEVTSSLEECIAGASLVFVCVPTSKHMQVINEIHTFGQFNLFIEKPLSHTLDGCDDLEFAFSRSKKSCSVGYMLRFHPVINELKKIVDQKVYGRPINVRVEAGFYLPFWHPWENYQDFYMSWKIGGGGALLDISHEIDYLNWIFGNIQEVNGLIGTVSDLEISSDDLSASILRFNSGLIGELHLDLLQFEESRYCKVIFTDGVVIADLMTNEIKKFSKNSKKWSVKKLKVDINKVYENEYIDIIDRARGKKSIGCSLRESSHVMQVIEGIRKSSSVSSSIKLPIY